MCPLLERGSRARVSSISSIVALLLAVSIHPACRPKVEAPPPAPITALPKLSFNEHIQPILSDNCYACHGSDARARKGELRLDRPEDAFAPRKTGPAIVKGDPASSTIIQRLHTKDPMEVMPPPPAVPR